VSVSRTEENRKGLVRVKCFPEKVLRATDGLESTVLASWAAEDIAKGGGAEPLVRHAVFSSHHDRSPKRGPKDARREAPNEHVRRIAEDGGTVAGAHIGEGRTVLAVGGPPEDDPGAGR
jgi:hypothetical protein